MSWNYRIVKYANGDGYGLHEVFYDLGGNPKSMTAEPAAFVGESAEDIRDAFVMSMPDAVNRPIFVEPEDWAVQKNDTQSEETEGLVLKHKLKPSSESRIITQNEKTLEKHVTHLESLVREMWDSEVDICHGCVFENNEKPLLKRLRQLAEEMISGRIRYADAADKLWYKINE